MDVARADTVDTELTRMIERKARKGETDPDEESELWQESVRRYNVRRREANRQEWCDYVGRLAESLRARAEEYDDRRAALLEEEAS